MCERDGARPNVGGTPWRAIALHVGDVYALVEATRQVWASLFVAGGPRGSHGRGRQLGPDAAFWIRAARHEATTPDSVAREGLWGAAEYPSVRVTCRLRELRCYSGIPARVRRFPAEGRH